VFVNRAEKSILKNGQVTSGVADDLSVFGRHFILSLVTLTTSLVTFFVNNFAADA